MQNHVMHIPSFYESTSQTAGFMGSQGEYLEGRNTDEKVSVVTMKTYVLSKRTISLHHNAQDFSPHLGFILRIFFQALHATDLRPPKVQGSFFVQIN